MKAQGVAGAGRNAGGIAGVNARASAGANVGANAGALPAGHPATGATPGFGAGAANAARHALPTRRVRVWDLPVRVFHWSLVLATWTALVTGKIGGSLMEVHAKAGLAIVGLVAFRLVWGVIGSAPARFASFAPTPGRVRGYLQGRWHGVGHNPLGALSVFALLGLLGVQATTGLFGNDDIAFTGPLYALVDEAFAGRLGALHQQLANLLIGLIVLHVAAIAFYRHVKKHKLVKPMITGWADIPLSSAAEREGARAVAPQATRRADDASAADAAPARQFARRGGLPAFLVALAIAVGAVWIADGSPWRDTAAPAAASPAATTTPQPAAAPGW